MFGIHFDSIPVITQENGQWVVQASPPYDVCWWQPGTEPLEGQAVLFSPAGVSPAILCEALSALNLPEGTRLTVTYTDKFGAAYLIEQGRPVLKAQALLRTRYLTWLVRGELS